MIKTAFFGGTFDPPHSGHLAIAETVLKSGLVDSVWLAPAWIPPHKTVRKISSFEDRLEMLKLAVRDVPGLEVTDFEQERKGLSYTLDTLDQLSERFPGREFVLLIGGDSLAQLHTWHLAEHLVRKYKILCWPRPHEKIDLQSLKEHWLPELAEKLEQSILPDCAQMEVSSSQIREMITKKGASPFVKPQVMEYIISRRLYT